MNGLGTPSAWTTETRVESDTVNSLTGLGETSALQVSLRIWGLWDGVGHGEAISEGTGRGAWGRMIVPASMALLGVKSQYFLHKSPANKDPMTEVLFNNLGGGHN